MTAVLQKKICMLGGFSVGKTSLVKRYVQSVFSETYLTTVGVKIDKKTVDLSDRIVHLILWDLAGEDDIRPRPFDDQAVRIPSRAIIVGPGKYADDISRLGGAGCFAG